MVEKLVNGLAGKTTNSSFKFKNNKKMRSAEEILKDYGLEV